MGCSLYSVRSLRLGAKKVCYNKTRFLHYAILLALGTDVSCAWYIDREIFRIRDEIAAHEVDASSTFYDILGISTSANQDDINKAFRKLTRSLHPDKIKQQLKTERDKRAKKAGTDKPPKPLTQKAIKAAVKDASERQARLSLIANILRGSGRDRYDHYLKNGFPLWKGTDYLYNRYRPGFGTALIGSFILCGGAIHYLILYMGWKRQKEFVERYVNFAKDKAWGGSGSPGVPGVDLPPAPPPVATDQDDEGGPPQALNRRQRRMQDRETKKDDGRGRVKKIKKDSKSQSASREGSTGPTGARKRVVAENGKVLVVDSLGDVYLEEQDKEGNVNEYLLDVSNLSPWQMVPREQHPANNCHSQTNWPNPPFKTQRSCAYLFGHSTPPLGDSLRTPNRNPQMMLRITRTRTRGRLSIPQVQTLQVTISSC